MNYISDEKIIKKESFDSDKKYSLVETNNYIYLLNTSFSN